MRRVDRQQPRRRISIKIHGVRWRVNNQHTGLPRLLQQRLHFERNRPNPARRTLAPVLIPHVCDHDGGPGRLDRPIEVAVRLNAGMMKRLDPCTHSHQNASARPQQAGRHQNERKQNRSLDKEHVARHF
jgi:hypothetical protein